MLMDLLVLESYVYLLSYRAKAGKIFSICEAVNPLSEYKSQSLNSIGNANTFQMI